LLQRVKNNNNNKDVHAVLLTSRMTSMTGADLPDDVTDRLSMTIRRRKSITNLRTGWLLASGSTPAHSTIVTRYQHQRITLPPPHIFTGSAKSLHYRSTSAKLSQGYTTWVTHRLNISLSYCWFL